MSGLLYLRILVLASLFVIPVFSQEAAPEVRVQLSLPDGKRVYRSGEPIRLVLSFTTDRDGYQVNVTTTKPANRPAAQSGPRMCAGACWVTSPATIQPRQYH